MDDRQCHLAESDEVIGHKVGNMDALKQDLRFGIRALLSRPAFTVVALLTLLVGIGANTAMFTVVNAVLLRPLSFPESDQIVVFAGTNPAKGITQSNMSLPDFADWKNQSQSFEQLAGFVAGGSILAHGDESERVRGTGVTVDFFPLFRTSPLKGRLLQPDDAEPGRESVVLLSHALWQRRFGADPNIVGTKVMLTTKPTTIVGVMPQGFDYPAQTEVWVPYVFDAANERRDNRFISVIGRLKNGVSIQQAQIEINTINQRLAQSYSDTNAGWGAQLTDLRESLVGGLRIALLVLLGAVAFVLLIACANVANLQLARATYRQKEMAVRSALGASRFRMIRQLLTESALLSALGGVLGLALSVWLTQLLISWSPPNSPRFDEIGIDIQVFLFTFAVTILTGLVFGLVPALQTSRPDVNDVLRGSGRQGSSGGKHNRVGGILMISEIALSVILLAGAGLLIQSFARLREVNPGFKANNVLTMRLSIPPGKIPPGPGRAQFYREVTERVKTLSGVQSASAVLSLPLGGDTFNVGRSFIREGRPATPEESANATYLVVTPDYWQTLQIPLKSGRIFTENDTDQTTKVVIINETMARQHWGGENPIGRRITIWRDEDFPREVVGVVGDTKSSLDTDPGAQMYVPYAQDPGWGSLTLAVRTAGEPTALVGSVREQIRSIDKLVPTYSVKTMNDVVQNSAAPRRTPMLLLTVFAGVALLLAMLGIYGVTAYYVRQRTQEIGIRIALGAQRADVLKLVLKRGMFLSLIGVIVGVAGAFALTRYLTTLLFGVPPVDPLTFAGVSLLLVLVALLACYVPARRALKVDPLVALRYE
jgi:putative ABC transport system permease protein